ncbi:MAG: ATP-dependent helicase HrpB [Myxococcaceae bacterium]|nr:ATP-dependent helicase HrpB [Myxococcaceae bacterium]MCI0668941.1 ATP-dependent helicase HrpB [Myxococcaceae bacterium]
MTLAKVGGVAAPVATPAPAQGGEPFRSLLHAAGARDTGRGVSGRAAPVGPQVGAAVDGSRGPLGPFEVEPRPVTPPQTSGTRAASAVTAASGPGTVTATRMVEQVSAAQRRMDHVLRLAQSGKTFSPAELLALQAHVYRASQELDLAGKVVEKATGGVKQVLQTQV